MLNEVMDGRRQRGLEIAATMTIAKKGDSEWMVPSQSEVKGKYHVTRDDDGFRCNCPDYELRGQTCKHGFAVEFVLRRETRPDGTVVETRAARVTYPQNWPAYNKAQTSEKREFCALLKDLVSSVPTSEQKRGRPTLPLSDMLFAAAFKVYSTVSTRRFMTDLESAQALGFIDKTPHYNSVINLLDREDLTGILEDLITRSALPLRALETQFAIDSTGFGTQCFYRHFSAKYGHDATFRDYIKLHAVVGTKTNVIVAARVSDRTGTPSSDTINLPELVSKTAHHFNMQEVSADKGYSSHVNLETVNEFAALPFVAFTKNAKGHSNCAIWNKMFHFFQMNRDEFLAHYHRRSNVESTFSAMKRKFRDTLRSKTRTAQQNELLLMVLCHNIVCVIHEIHESGATAMFPALTGSCPRNPAAAQQVLGWE